MGVLRDISSQIDKVLDQSGGAGPEAADGDGAEDNCQREPAHPSGCSLDNGRPRQRRGPPVHSGLDFTSTLSL